MFKYVLGVVFNLFISSENQQKEQILTWLFFAERCKYYHHVSFFDIVLISQQKSFFASLFIFAEYLERRNFCGAKKFLRREEYFAARRIFCGAKNILRREEYFAARRIFCGAKNILRREEYFAARRIFCGAKNILRREEYFAARRIFCGAKNILRREEYFAARRIFCGAKNILRREEYFAARRIFCGAKNILRREEYFAARRIFCGAKNILRREEYFAARRIFCGAKNILRREEYFAARRIFCATKFLRLQCEFCGINIFLPSNIIKNTSYIFLFRLLITEKIIICKNTCYRFHFVFHVEWLYLIWYTTPGKLFVFFKCFFNKVPSKSRRKWLRDQLCVHCLE